MSVYKRGGIYWYAFQYRGRRYQGSTGQALKEDAKLVEHDQKKAVRKSAHGLGDDPGPMSPRFQDWAEHYYLDVTKRVARPERVEDLIRVALRFWGGPPADPTTRHPDGVYHDLKLGDVVAHPSWILQWETWLEAPKHDADGTHPRRWAGQTKNQYRSVLSQMFRLAMSPPWRALTGVTSNPFLGTWRDRGGAKTVALELDDILAILGQASYHLRLAVAVALLTPKLREGNILALKFSPKASDAPTERAYIAEDFSRLVVDQHKSRGRTGLPLVAYVPEQMREILQEAKRRAGRSRHLITYQGQPVTQLRGAVRGAVERAAATRPHLLYGRAHPQGITFHTLRHSAATRLAELDVSPEKRQQLLGHRHLATTMLYTHLRPTAEAAPAEQLSTSLPIKDLVLAVRRRPPARVKNVETVSSRDPESSVNPRDRTHRAPRQKTG